MNIKVLIDGEIEAICDIVDWDYSENKIELKIVKCNNFPSWKDYYMIEYLKNVQCNLSTLKKIIKEYDKEAANNEVSISEILPYNLNKLIDSVIENRYSISRSEMEKLTDYNYGAYSCYGINEVNKVKREIFLDSISYGKSFNTIKKKYVNQY